MVLGSRLSWRTMLALQAARQQSRLARLSTGIIRPADRVVAWREPLCMDSNATLQLKRYWPTLRNHDTRLRELRQSFTSSCQ